MARSTKIFSLAIVAALLQLLARPTAAQESAAAKLTAEPLPISVKISPEPVQTVVPIARIVTTVNGQKVTFRTPNGYAARADAAAAKVVLSNSDGSRAIVFRVLAPKPFTLESYRAILLDRYPNAIILEELSVNAAGLSGPAFDLSWKTPGGFVQAGRFAFIQSPVGVLEFSFLTSAEKFAKARSDLNALLLNFLFGDGSALPPLSGSL